MIGDLWRFWAALIAVFLFDPSFAQDHGPSSSAGTVAVDAGTSVKNAAGGVSQDRSANSPAAALFVEKCSMCHRQLGMGTVLLARRMDTKIAMLEARSDLTVDFVLAIARNGVGNMPKISRGEVSDAQLQTIARYLSKVSQ